MMWILRASPAKGLYNSEEFFVVNIRTFLMIVVVAVFVVS